VAFHWCGDYCKAILGCVSYYVVTLNGFGWVPLVLSRLLVWSLKQQRTGRVILHAVANEAFASPEVAILGGTSLRPCEGGGRSTTPFPLVRACHTNILFLTAYGIVEHED
jgi:hypothetical protein